MINPHNLLFEAIESSDIERVRKALEEGVDVNKADPRKLHGEGNTPLHDAANNGQIKIVKSLIDAGADVNARCNHGWTPLIRACNAGNIEVGRILVEAGADVNAKNNEGYTALGRTPGNIVELILFLKDNGGQT